MTKSMTILGTAGLLIAAAFPVSAHHSFSAEFDVDKPVKLEGTVVKMDWVNPHTWLYIDVKKADGTVEHWQVEGGAPGVLLRNGWTKNTLAPEPGSSSPDTRPRTALSARTPAISSSPTAVSWTPAAATTTEKRNRRR